MKRMVDDFIYGRACEEFTQGVHFFLKKCYRQHRVIPNRAKVQPPVKLTGFIISSNGYQPDPALTAAIRNFRAPVGIGGLRRFFGFVNQIGPFSEASPDTCSLCELY